MAYSALLYKLVIPTNRSTDEVDQALRPAIRAIAAQLFAVDGWRVYLESEPFALAPDELAVLRDRYPDDPSFQ